MKKTFTTVVLVILLATLSFSQDKTIPAALIEQIKASKSKKGKVDTQLIYLIENEVNSSSMRISKTDKKERSATGELKLVTKGELVAVEILATADLNTLLDDLYKLGFKKVVAINKTASGYLPKNSVSALEKLSSVRQVKAVASGESEIGSVFAEGDSAQFSNIVKEQYQVDGAGVRIGILSTSFNLLEGQAQSVLDGDLPGPNNPNGYLNPVVIVREGVERAFPVESVDEGRAMAELVHDVAPGAEIYFYGPPFTSDATLAQAIDTLAQLGCDIIVDDLTNLTEPVYLDGLASQAIDRLPAQNILYFAAVGNRGNSSVFESEYNETETPTGPGLNFDTDPEVNGSSLALIDVTRESEFGLAIQWDEPWASTCEGCPGSQVDLDVYVFSIGLGGLIFRSTGSEINGDPVISFDLQFRYLDSAETDIVIVWIDRASSQAPNRVWIQRKGNATIDLDYVFEGNPTILGHKNALNSITVGSVSWRNTPAYSTLETPQVLRSDDNILGSAPSLGGIPMYFDTNGNRLTQPETRLNPSIMAPDGSSTSFFGQDVPSSENPQFFGTSAAAPTAAASAALLIQAANDQLSSVQIRSIIEATALDLDDPYINGRQLSPSDPLYSIGYDFASGYGYNQPQVAILAIIDSLGVQPIFIEQVCSENPGVERKFKVTNPNGFGWPVQVSSTDPLRLEGEQNYNPLTREITFAGGETFIYTQLSFASSVSLTLTWSPAPGTFGLQLARVRTNATPACEDPGARIAKKVEEEDITSNFSYSLYPNPTVNGKVQLSYASPTDEVLDIKVYDNAQRLIYHRTKNIVQGENVVEIDLHNPKPGIYFIQFSGLVVSDVAKILVK